MGTKNETEPQDVPYMSYEYEVTYQGVQYKVQLRDGLTCFKCMFQRCEEGRKGRYGVYRYVGECGWLREKGPSTYFLTSEKWEGESRRGGEEAKVASKLYSHASEPVPCGCSGM